MSELLDIAGRVWPVLLFLVFVQLLAELCDQAGLFEVAAHLAARVARGRVLALFGLVLVLATVCTWLLSIDTTAVLLTPIGLTLAAELGLDALPFAFASLWLANTASLLLPVSNLTNLLAQERLQLGAVDFVGHTWVAQLAVLSVVVLVLLVRHRSSLRGHYAVPSGLPRHDPALLGLATLVVLGIGPGILMGVPAWEVALGAVLVLIAGFVVRRPAAVAPARLGRMVPFGVLGFAIALFAVLGLLATRLSGPVLGLTGSGSGLGSLLRLGGVTTALSNLVDNLPAYLLAEPVAHTTSRLLTVLVATNAGPLLLLWGSLANLLWLRSCRAHGLRVTVWSFLREGLLVVPLAVVAGVLAIAVV